MPAWKREGEESGTSSSSNSVRSSTVRYQVSLFRDFELFVSSVSKCQRGRVGEERRKHNVGATVSLRDDTWNLPVIPVSENGGWEKRTT